MSDLPVETTPGVAAPAHEAARGRIVYITEQGERVAAIVPAAIAAELERLSPDELAELLEDFADAAAARDARASIEAGEPLVNRERCLQQADLKDSHRRGIAASARELWTEISPRLGEPWFSKSHRARIEASMRKRWTDKDFSFDDFLVLLKLALCWSVFFGFLFSVGLVVIAGVPALQLLSRRSALGVGGVLILVAVVGGILMLVLTVSRVSRGLGLGGNDDGLVFNATLDRIFVSPKSMAFLFFAQQFVVWTQFLFIGRGESQPFAISQGAWTSPNVIVSGTFAILTSFALAILVLASRRSNGLALAATLNTILVLIGFFSSLYWRSGGCVKTVCVNWGMSLSRSDALLVALGNFTTAGTPGITPQSEFARKIVTLQMGLDVIVGTLLIGLLIARLTRK